MNRQQSTFLYNRKLAVLAVIMLGLAVVFWLVMRYSRSPMIRLAELQFVRIQALEPAEPMPRSLRMGVQSFYETNYSSALISLGEHLQNQPDSFYGYFYSGLTRLKRAPLRILGVTLAFEPEAVRLALRDFENAMNRSPNKARKADCLWFMAKARLMMHQPREAENLLQQILNLSDQAPERAQDARGLLQRINTVIGP